MFRSKEIIIRHRFLRIEDGELFFYQQLLLNVPAKSEADYKITPDGTYREKFLSLYWDYVNTLEDQLASTHEIRISRLNNQFVEMLDRLIHSLTVQLPNNLSRIIENQMNNLKILPCLYPQRAMLELPADQYHAISTINMYMEKNDGVKWP
ncbi:uncharacterized protein OCT59_016939 [Rhizophagus irregularis]|uniref:Uncharacterized protein n=1 Tax=Rhizophagus irregularis (strain DAOM 197198w) TaxID=1432141 RepID=A0A015KAT8_RHIIW|nr:hypothetical protein RirG_010790 [Rhizophagus irregularis DAOM 197198w]UZO24644.1 hypothetical protein OCT59_016939 [Rhizophagus irregularis]